MPVIQGADLTAVSTSMEPVPESEVVLDIVTSEFSDDKNKIIIKTKIVEHDEERYVGREFWDWCNVTGDHAHIGLQQIKRYLEAVFGKGSPQAEASPPDTDVLHGSRVRAYLTVDSWKDQTGQEKKGNKAKRIMAV